MTRNDLSRVGISVLGLFFLVEGIAAALGSARNFVYIAAGVWFLVVDDWITGFLFGRRPATVD